MGPDSHTFPPVPSRRGRHWRVPPRVATAGCGEVLTVRRMTITHPTPTRRLIDSVELRSLWPVGRTTFYKAIKSPDFPTPIQLVDGGDYLWYLEEVAAWLETRRRHPGRDVTAEPAAEDPAPRPELIELRPVRRTRRSAPTRPGLVELRPVARGGAR